MKFSRLVFGLAVIAGVSGCASLSSHQLEPQLVLAAAGKVRSAERLRCPGVGSADCEANWRALQLGQTQADVEHWIGSEFQSEQDIFIDRVESRWLFESGGRLVFSNGSLVAVELPQEYLFPGRKTPNRG